MHSRADGGRLPFGHEVQCAYHRWCFDGATGLCTSIPNLRSDEQVKPSARVRAFATAETVADALGWQLRTGLSPAVEPPTGDEPMDARSTMFETRVSDDLSSLVWTGSSGPPLDGADRQCHSACRPLSHPAWPRRGPRALGAGRS